MTDKQIIDEERMFECVWCKYGFKESDANFILSENPNECVCSGCITEWADNLLCDLKRKEQECEELKDKLNCCFCNPHIELNDIEKQQKCIEVTECFRRQLDQLKAQLLDQETETLKAGGIISKYKQTLAEIKEIAEAHKKDESVWNPYRQLDKILQKISEVEDD